MSTADDVQTQETQPQEAQAQEAQTQDTQAPEARTQTAPAETARSYRVRVSDAELQSWMQARAGAPFLRGQSAIDGLILTRTLADEARQAGLDLAPRTRIELMRVQGRAAMARLKSRLSKEIQVDEAEIDAELENNPPKLLPERRRMRNLFLRFGSEDPTTVKQQIEDLRRRVLDGADFEALARQWSQSETRYKGGLLGNVKPGTFPPAVDKIIQELKAGEVSEILESSEGFTLLYCERVLPAVSRPLEDIRRHVANRLHRKHYEERLESAQDALRAKASMSILAPILAPILETQDSHGESSRSPTVRFTGHFLTSDELSVVVGRRPEQPWPESRKNGAWENRAQESGSWGSAWHQALDRFVLGRMAFLDETEQGRRPTTEERSAELWEERRILAAAMLAHRAESLFQEPTETDLARAFEQNPDRYVWPESYDLEVICLSSATQEEEETAAARARAGTQAVELLTSLKAGNTSFREIARRHSRDPSASQGGQIQDLPLSRVAPRLGLDVTRALKNLKLGELSELIWQDTDIWIIRPLALKKERPATFEEARRGVRRDWIDRELARIQEELVARHLEELDIR